MVYNLGGPDRSLRMEDFATGHLAPARYRNRRLGDFLKELDLTEGRATGLAAIIKIMRNNGSPDPVFETDEDRTWFRVTLPIHVPLQKKTKPVRNSALKYKLITFVNMKAIKNIELKISRLSPGLIRELDSYLDYLVNKRVVRRPKRLRQDWAGGLKDIKMTSIELQKKALDWR